MTAPLTVTLHGSASWTFDGFFLWYQAPGFGFGILAVQWRTGPGEEAEAYYALRSAPGTERRATPGGQR